MKTIIAPTDFSTISYNACLYAAKMAEDVKADLFLLYVMELPLLATEVPLAMDVYDEAEIQEELKKLKEKLSEETHGKVKIETQNIPGTVEYQLKQLCEEENPFLVIMGTHSSGVLNRFFLGSATIYSAQHLHYPVLVVPVGVKYRPIKKIALASDLQDVYQVPVHEIEMILDTLGASLEVFFVGKNERIIDRFAVPGLLLLQRFLNAKPQFFNIEDEDVEQSIAALAENHNIDIVLIMPKKHGLFHKSTSKDFILYSPLPVMAIHENDLVEQSGSNKLDHALP